MVVKIGSKFSSNFYYEKKIWNKGFDIVLGLDEAGRGALAGPLVCGAVCFDKNEWKRILSKVGEEKIVINDSKKLTRLQREKAFSWIKRNAFSWGVGVASVAEINRLGIARATFSAFRRSIRDAERRMGKRVSFILIDAFYIPYVGRLRMPSKEIRKANRRSKNKKISANQLAIIHGDEKSFSISAASIVSKVYRDRIMEKLSKNRVYKKYNWSKNKGYGTRDHIEALRKYGKTRLHRDLFIDSILQTVGSS